MWKHSGFHSPPFGEPHELAGVLRNLTSSYAEHFRDASRNGSAQYIVIPLQSLHLSEFLNVSVARYMILSALLVFLIYLSVIYTVRMEEVNDFRFIFVPSSISLIMFFFSFLGEMYIFCIHFIVEAMNILILCLSVNREVALEIIFTIVFSIILGFITFGLADFGFGLEEGIEITDNGGASGSDTAEISETSGELGESEREGLDLDGDGEIEGFDLDGDGEIEQNIIGVEVPGTESVDGYTREDGTQVAPYVRTEADDRTLNNLNPNW